ncbi:MAG: polyphosphate:AMP phosphotransferase [Planctomycetota bacterium]|nr:polyphosphate:AMP phosphotransferase [Planctomycetota bacterium]
MFEAAELGQKMSKAEFKEKAPLMRQKLLEAQRRLAEANFPVIILLSGVDKGGKGGTASILNTWFDARLLVTRAYDEPTQEERERPEFWRFWRDLPSKGSIGIFMSAWYSRPFLDHVFERSSDDHFSVEMERIADFERTLAHDGALILKFWLHLGKDAQKRRFEAFEADPLLSWRVRDQDWKHWERYEDFVASAEELVKRTSTGFAPWTIVEGEDENYRTMRICTSILEALDLRLKEAEREARHRREDAKRAAKEQDKKKNKKKKPDEENELALPEPATVLDTLDMSRSVTKKEYKVRLKELQGRLNELSRRARDEGVSTVLVFEGWDAGGKGGAIRRMLGGMHARNYQVISIAAPTDEEAAQHYLWRFWRHLPRAGRVSVFDRSWYGRVLVERVEGFARPKEWRRAYAEINDFEQQLVDHGDVVLKFWMHVTKDEQARRFEERRVTPHKQWKLTEEDWRNREKWDAYELAVNEMVERTSTKAAPWVLVEGNDKRYARLRVLEAVCDALERRLIRAAEAAEAPTEAGTTS